MAQCGEAVPTTLILHSYERSFDARSSQLDASWTQNGCSAGAVRPWLSGAGPRHEMDPKLSYANAAALQLWNQLNELMDCLQAHGAYIRTQIASPPASAGTRHQRIQRHPHQPKGEAIMINNARVWSIRITTSRCWVRSGFAGGGSDRELPSINPTQTAPNSRRQQQCTNQYSTKKDEKLAT